jgi:hypothetical protein
MSSAVRQTPPIPTTIIVLRHEDVLQGMVVGPTVRGGVVRVPPQPLTGLVGRCKNGAEDLSRGDEQVVDMGKNLR